MSEVLPVSEIPEPGKIKITSKPNKIIIPKASLPCRKKIWNLLSEEEKNQISGKYAIALYPDDEYGIITDAQTMNRSRAGSTAMSETGSLVGQSAYIDNTSWGSYSALKQVGFGILGGLLGNTMDRPAKISYETRYTIRLLNGEIIEKARYGSSGFYMAPGRCVNAHTLSPVEIKFCAGTSLEAFRQKHSDFFTAIP